MKKLPDRLDSLRRDFLNRYEIINKTIGVIAEILENQGIQYCVFKTLRSVPYLAPDLDILIFCDQHLFRAINAVKEKLHAKAENSMGISNYNCSLYLDQQNFYVDIYARIHVAGFVYISKEKLQQFCTKAFVQGKPVIVLEPEYELVALVGHAIFKEQRITLLDYLCVDSLLSKIDPISLERALINTSMSRVFFSFMRAVKGSSYFPMRIKSFEFLRLASYKFFEDSEAKKTILNPIIELLRSRQKLATAVEHLRRETY